MIVKVFMTLNIDPEEYTIPVDGLVSDELEQFLREYFYDIEGMAVKKISITQEGKN